MPAKLAQDCDDKKLRAQLVMMARSGHRQTRVKRPIRSAGPPIRCRKGQEVTKCYVYSARGPTTHSTDGSDLSRLPHVNGAGRQKAHALHQSCGSYLSLRVLRDQNEADCEGALDNEVQSVPTSSAIHLRARQETHSKMHCAGVVPNRSIRAMKLIGCSQVSQFGPAENWDMLQRLPAIEIPSRES